MRFAGEACSQRYGSYKQREMCLAGTKKYALRCFAKVLFERGAESFERVAFRTAHPAVRGIKGKRSDALATTDMSLHCICKGNGKDYLHCQRKFS